MWLQGPLSWFGFFCPPSHVDLTRILNRVGPQHIHNSFPQRAPEVYATSSGDISVWEGATGDLRTTVSMILPIDDFALLPDGWRLVAIGRTWQGPGVWAGRRLAGAMLLSESPGARAVQVLGMLAVFFQNYGQNRSELPNIDRNRIQFGRSRADELGQILRNVWTPSTRNGRLGPESAKVR